MQNLGSGGEAKASPADRADAEGDLAAQRETGAEADATASEGGGTMDAALGADRDPSLAQDDDADGTIAPARPSLGANETAAYGET